MSRLLHAAAAIAAAIAVPTTAAAGYFPPLSWQYSSYLIAAGTGFDARPMHYAFIGSNGSGADGRYALFAHLTGSDEMPPLAYYVGAAPVLVGSYNLQTVNWANERPPTRERFFELGVTITDLTSFDLGTVYFTGQFLSPHTWDWPPNPTTWVLTSPPNATIQVGSNIYDLRLLPKGPLPYDPSVEGQMQVDVDVRPAPEVPEPATLVLAAAAIGVMSVVWGCRRCVRRTIPCEICR
jgi:PEP-CTERM motif